MIGGCRSSSGKKFPKESSQEAEISCLGGRLLEGELQEALFSHSVAIEERVSSDCRAKILEKEICLLRKQSLRVVGIYSSGNERLRSNSSKEVTGIWRRE